MLVVVGINEELQMIRVLVIPLMMMVICGVVILAAKAKQSVHGTADSGWAHDTQNAAAAASFRCLD